MVGQDALIGAWLFKQADAQPRSFNLAVGILDRQGRLAGGFMFTDFDGTALEAHFWGPGVMTRRAVRELFRIALNRFNPQLIVAHANKPSMARGLQKIGASLQGLTGNSGGRFGRFHFPRAVIERLAAQEN